MMLYLFCIKALSCIKADGVIVAFCGLVVLKVLFFLYINYEFVALHAAFCPSPAAVTECSPTPIQFESPFS